MDQEGGCALERFKEDRESMEQVEGVNRCVV